MRGQLAEGRAVLRTFERTWHALAMPGRPRRDQLELLRSAAELWDQDMPDVGYLASLFTRTSLPYKDPGNVPMWGRRNGNMSLIMQPGMKMGPDGQGLSIGYPYGTVPRLLLTWLSTEAVRTQSPVLELGSSLAEFMRALELKPTGGRNGTIGRLRKQMERLFAASLSVQWEGDPNREAGARLNVASAYDLWWADADPSQPSLLPSTVRLSDEFYREVTEHPVPLDLGALRALRGSPLRLDIYAWLTYRMYSLGRRTEISWDSLRQQFGSGHADNTQGRKQFRRDFITQLREVMLVYRDANVETSLGGLVILPSRTHVRALPRRST